MLDVNHFKQNRDAFSGCTKILEKKFVLEQISSPSNMIFFSFMKCWMKSTRLNVSNIFFQHCMLDEIFDLLNSAYNLG